MVVAIGLWSVAVTPGEPTIVVPEADIQITNVALGDKIEENSRGTLKLTYLHASSRDSDDEEEEEEEEDDDEPKMLTTTLCSLTPGSIEQASINVILEEGQEFLFELVGKNTLYLTGNYIDQTPPNDLPPFGDSDDEEEDYDLRSVGSDVEAAMDELESDASRFEEVDEKVSGKRARASDAMDTDEAKPAGDKKAKKQKGENGEAIPVAAAAEEKPLTKKEKKQKAKETKEAKEDEKNKQSGEKKADTTPKKAAGEEKELSGGVKIKDSKVGTGPTAKAGNTVGMRYIGKLQNGKVFDKNVKGKPFTFQLGAGEVIKGWDVGIAGMQVGGERLLTIPPGMGYGKRKSGDIPPNSTLIFEVKLVEIK